MENVGLAIFNVLLVVCAAPLLDGVLRQVKARIHSRQGPPILQTYFDLAKLLVKEDQRGVNQLLFAWAPVVCMASVILSALFVPMAGLSPLGFSGDAIVFLYVLTMAPLCMCLGGMASGSPYAYAGANREIMTLMAVEPVVAICLITSGIRAHSLNLADCVNAYAAGAPALSMIIATIAFFLILPAELSKVPFDQAEAETEIMEGPLIEYSGRKLALFKWSFYAKQIVLITLFVEWFLPWPHMNFVPLDILATLIKVVIVAVIIEVIAQIFPRFKIHQSIRYFYAVVAFSVGGLVLAVMGL
ncbi:respiratory chain complex I subunit 1 family protein [Rhodospirillum rubrum]|uniref:Respiratory-chain NADH dehydrogenase, subunit 1 n=1 Tax=Rhodospirillum rubrum (strain ATCC 11170 / ATH 1.1.1 / DSM 467 / LMG 4362 / NCIMB 8255 / S1) TaxID=269796 RepID=Q2RXM3_RHORT|nr:NADH-quinone oxidoreductase subunit H [Rhodospirillum rubrum]ABC21122.1 Respiratory-chain NADH dehydrogenase, subunit 1 [Rhodospirillum rubrum ATCC 11170]AEO46790.1 respiratory-chain NADH dehydrogenase, subunit 1 [Rhodospirillum rubrum F11]MBK5952669.1 formate hydrogenlyase subunit 4 [Rhodospirillum rubrum]QXG80814.1 NADH-quinone oxidoreductase subunit H [Rhodospirillum rubrum]HAQ00445.1 NADH-quinone oxidoreductase subunit H [Rhodospirillum rubrum]